MPSATFTATVDRASQREIAAAIAGVKYGVANRVIKQAVAKVARAAGRDVKQKAPAGRSGTLKRSVGTAFKGRPKLGRWTYKVGPRKGFKTVVNGRNADPVNYGHLVEGGRREVRPKRRKALLLGTITVNGRDAKGRFKVAEVAGLVRRKARAVAAKPFVGPVWRQIQATGVGRIAADVKAGIAREAMKYAARGKSIYR